MNHIDDYTSEEQEHPEIVAQLTKLYPDPATNAQSLGRIRERLIRSTSSQPGTQPVLVQPVSIEAEEGKIIPFPGAVQKKRRPWQRLFNLVAAVALVTIIVGSLAALFNQFIHTAGGTPLPQGLYANPVMVPETPYVINSNVAWLTTTVSLGDKRFRGPLLRTSDGGKSWQDVSLQGSTEWSMYTPIDEQVAFAITASTLDTAGEALYRTDDGGKSWRRLPVPTEPGHSTRQAAFDAPVHFIDRNHGWATSYSNAKPAPGSNYSPEDLFGTSDGGKTWQYLSRLPGQYTNIQFVDMRHGWATSDSIENENVDILQTEDGGHTWIRNKLPALPANPQNHHVQFSYRFFNEHDGYLLIVATLDLGKSQAQIYSTHDGGKSWQQPTTIKYAGGNEFHPDSGDIINDHLLFLSNDTSGSLYTLTGQQWVKSTMFSAYKHLENHNFASKTVGFAVVSNRQQGPGDPVDKGVFKLLKTTDGGKSWTPLQVDVPITKLTPLTMGYYLTPGWAYFLSVYGRGPKTLSPRTESPEGVYDNQPTYPPVKAKKWLVRFICMASGFTYQPDGSPPSNAQLKINAQLAINGVRLSAPTCHRQLFSTVVSFDTPQSIDKLSTNFDYKEVVWSIVFMACTDEWRCEADK